MNAPPFSIFSAVSELFVTAGVLFVIRRNWTRRPFPFALFLGVALFEGLVNVLYMANRASEASAGHAAAAALPVGESGLGRPAFGCAETKQSQTCDSSST